MDANELFNQVMGGLAERKNYVEKVAIPEIQAAEEKFGAASAVQQEAVTKEADAVARVTADKGRQASELEQRVNQLGQTMMPDSLRFRLASEIQAETERMITSSAEHNKLQATSFFDNPVAYLVDSLQRPQAATEVAQSTQRLELLNDQMAKVSQATTAGAQALKNTAITITAAGREAEIDQIVAAGIKEKARLARDNAVTGAQFTMQLANLDKESRATVETSLNMRWRQDEQNRSWERFNLEKEQFAANKSARADAKAEKETEDALIMRMRDQAVAQAKLMGKDKLAEDFMLLGDNPRKLAAQLKADKQFGGTFADEFGYYAQMGRRTQDLKDFSGNPGTFAIGGSPAEAAANILNRNLKVSPQALRVAQTIRAAQADEVGRAGPQWNTLSEQEKAAKLKEAAERGIREASAKAVPPSAVLLARANSADPVQASPLYKAIKADAQPKVLESWDSLYAQTKEAVVSGAISPQVAAKEIVELATAARVQDNTEVNYLGFGTAMPSTLYVGAKPAAAGGKIDPGVDLTDIKAVTQRMLEQKNTVRGRLNTPFTPNPQDRANFDASVDKAVDLLDRADRRFTDFNYSQFPQYNPNRTK